MKITKNKTDDNGGLQPVSNRASNNQSKRNAFIIIVIVITALLITWVYAMGDKATSTVTVAMTKQTIYKNQMITEEMLQPYEMVKAEFEKYAVKDSNGDDKRRVILWDERTKIIGGYAAYPLQENAICEFRQFYKDRIDNSDTVMYSFPGKEIVSLDIASQDLQTFKTFLRPGDRVTISAVYSEEENVQQDDGFGGTKNEKVVTYKTENVFNDILVADLLNDSGASILDIYEDYNGKSVDQQAALDASASFKDSVTPKSLLVALTPEEKEEYYYFLSKSGITFRMSLPQRVQ